LDTIPSKPSLQAWRKTMSPASTHGPGGFAHQLGKYSLALLERRAAKVFAAEFEEIEGEQHRLGLRLAAVAQSVEYRDAIFAADHDFAVD
jgi:hypothetical protein